MIQANLAARRPQVGEFQTRFAPSPTYYLHLGHAASALHVWRAAERAGGRVLLRIEDIDTTRCRPEYSVAILEDLAWLGLDWPNPVRVQSEHFADYANCVDSLRHRGLAYRCFRSRAELQTLPNPEAPGPHPVEEEARRQRRGDPFAWRLSLNAARDALGPLWHDLSYQEQVGADRVTRSAQPERHGDIVIARKDSPSAYHVAVTHDDALQGVTHVIRGQDLVEGPHIHTLLQILMDWPRPIYQHHALILDENGQKLSKRQKSISLASLRADGMTSEQVKARLGFA
jgi:glutamyl-Q tRNA(Asp) synthetase